jgi:Skp family chaperone for outer membrane proteins
MIPTSRKSAPLNAALALLFCLCFKQAIARQPQTSQPTRNASTQVDASTAPPCKIAVIDTAAFRDERTGIKRVVRVLKQAELESRRRELEIADAEQRIHQLSIELNESARSSDEQAEQQLRQKREQLDQLRNDLQRKIADHQSTASSLKKGSSPAPLDDEIQRAMIAFARSRGFTLLLDQAGDRTNVIWASDAIDLTKDFIKDFNSRFPAEETAAPKP